MCSLENKKKTLNIQNVKTVVHKTKKNVKTSWSTKENISQCS